MIQVCFEAEIAFKVCWSVRCTADSDSILFRDSCELEQQIEMIFTIKSGED
jgi:hypothetical protein